MPTPHPYDATSKSQRIPQPPPARAGIARRLRDFLRTHPFQIVAIVFCTLFGIAMVLNNQMEGEAFWFWYATLVHSGAKLYTGLHFVLQPLYILQTDAWMQLFGTKTVVTEIPSVFEVLAYCVAMFLVLRESDWPDWQKAAALAGAFFISIHCTAYRFDDYHITTDTYIFLSLALLLILARTTRESRQFALVAAIGILCGFTITTRVNDGGALLAAACLALFFLPRSRKLLSVALFLASALLTVIVVVKLTGDSLSSYVSNSVLKAAAAKGGGGSILHAPLLLFHNALKATLRVLPQRKKILLFAVATVGATVFACRSRKLKTSSIFLAQSIIVFALCLLVPMTRRLMWSGQFVDDPAQLLIILTYLLGLIVAMRWLWSMIRPNRNTWDHREVLVFLPLAGLASASTSTAGETISLFLSPIAMLLLLVPVLQPFRKQAGWLIPSFLTTLLLIGTSGMLSKIWNPYSWINYRSSPMFENRQWYHHPVWGTMYLDSDLLHFIEPVCREIAESGGKPELLSMPYSYPNYFCDTPPWHGYVATFFDTSARATINHLMQELDSAPPQWIVYERQVRVIGGQESLYSHGQPLPQRALDTMIMQKIASGEWQLIETRHYLEGDGWLIIKTR